VDAGRVIELEAIEPASLLADRAYTRLRDAILANELRPGTPLSVPELARQMRISRSPAREAVQRLIYEGLAVHVPFRGAVVAVVDPDDIRELYLVRELLEGLAARLATERIDAAQLAELKAVLAEHERVVACGDERAHVELNMAYHRKIREIGGNAHLNAVLHQVHGKAHLAIHQLWRGPDAARLAVEEHRSILDAIEAHDPDAADRAARAHIAALRARLSPTKEDPT
jgi:DNA-binding GntR family transcriptional regulator